jgi:hypothetical protein
MATQVPLRTVVVRRLDEAAARDQSYPVEGTPGELLALGP